MLNISRKKILQILPHMNDGGVPQGCIDIARAVIMAKGKAYVASAGGKRCGVLNEIGAQHFNLPLDTKNLLKILKNAQRLSSFIKDQGIDLIHARSRAPAWSGLWAARMNNIPFVTTFHGTYNFSNNIKKYYNSVMARGDRVIAISNFIQQHIYENYSAFCNPENIRLIHRGIDLQFFSPQEMDQINKDILSRSWQAKDHQKIIVMPGRLTRWKGQLTLLKALTLLPRGIFKCIFVGSDQGRKNYSSELKAFAQENNLTQDIFFQGSFSPMPQAYAAADIVVHASSDPEAFGRVIAEAQAMGKPVIASNIGAPSEIILNGETGWLFAPEFPEQLAQVLKDFLKITPDKLETIAIKARQNIERNFSYELMAQKTLQVYEELLQNKL